MKPFRIVFSVLLILVALWVIVGEQMSGASANAVVNAPVVTLRADTAGDLQLTDRPFGARVQAGETLATVTDELVDTIRLNDLRMELDLARAETTRIAADLEGTRALRQSLLDRTAAYRRARVEELTMRLDHARRRLEILETREGLRDPDTAPVTAPAVDDVATTGGTAADAPEAQASIRYENAEGSLPLTLERAREEVAVLENALATAEQGIFLGDGYNDAPNAEQRATELASDVGTLKAALAASRANERAYDARINRESLRVNALTGGDITAPVNGLYWEILQASGVNVQRGDPILRLVNCDAVIVTLSVTERIYNSLRIGQAATFRLSGSDRVYDATVARLAGSGAATVYNHLAVAPSQKHLERYDVTLLVPGLVADAGRGCAVGQTGRAFFDARPLDWLRTLFN